MRLCLSRQMHGDRKAGRWMGRRHFDRAAMARTWRYTTGGGRGGTASSASSGSPGGESSAILGSRTNYWLFPGVYPGIFPVGESCAKFDQCYPVGRNRRRKGGDRKSVGEGKRGAVR